MSYCRWSTSDFQCDLYAYEDVDGGWTIHVASNRVVGIPPHEDWTLLIKGGDAEAAAFWQQHAALDAWLETCEHAPIGLAYDGCTFRDYSRDGFKARLLLLREAGYHFPDYVIEHVDEEIAEAARAPEQAS